MQIHVHEFFVFLLLSSPNKFGPHIWRLTFNFFCFPSLHGHEENVNDEIICKVIKMIVTLTWTMEMNLIRH